MWRDKSRGHRRHQLQQCQQ
uniref:Uncharacterized protein n=1 Tax=Anguilla anguilla TaxID=7936 RepID=A0A0E9URZ3_ANGAN